MNIDRVTNEQLEAALLASIARRTSNATNMSMDNYHCLATSSDTETVPDEHLIHIGGENAEEFYSVPIDVRRLRQEILKLVETE